jgi:hypothetical protein
MYSEMSDRELELNQEERDKVWDEYIRMLDPVSPMQSWEGWYTYKYARPEEMLIRVGWDTRAEPYIPT